MSVVSIGVLRLKSGACYPWPVKALAMRISIAHLCKQDQIKWEGAKMHNGYWLVLGSTHLPRLRAWVFAIAVCTLLH